MKASENGESAMEIFLVFLKALPTIVFCQTICVTVASEDQLSHMKPVTLQTDVNVKFTVFTNLCKYISCSVFRSTFVVIYINDLPSLSKLYMTILLFLYRMLGIRR